MASGVSDFGVATWLPALFGITTAPAGYWVGLLSNEPGPASDGDTVTVLEPGPATGYARIWYAAGSAGWAAAGPYVSNLNDIEFGTPTDAWGPVNHFVLCTAATSGDLYGWGELVAPLSVLPGAPVTIPAGALVVTMNSLVSSIAV